MIEEHRVIDKEQIQRTLCLLEGTVKEYRATHRTNDGIRSRLARIAVLKMMLKKL